MHVRQKGVLVTRGGQGVPAHAAHAQQKERMGPHPRVSLRSMPQVAPRAPLGGVDTIDGIPPPASLNVDGDGRVVLYDHRGTPLKRAIGFTYGR